MTIAVADDRRTLPARYYIDDDVLARERQMLRDHWQLVGHEAQLPARGDYITARLFDSDYFVIRGDDNGLRAFANVCPHRGHVLLEGCGHKGRITCPYHAWTFDRSGRLVGARRTETTELPTRGEIRLFEVALDQLAGFIFLNVSGKALPLNEFAPGLDAQIARHCPELGSYVVEDGPALGHTYECAANWKVLIDNYLECHHCSVAHSSFDDMMDISNSRFELFPNYTFQTAPTALKSENKAFPLNLDHDVTVGHFWWLFPNMVFGQFPGVPGFYASRFDAVGAHQTHRQTWSLTVAEPTDSDMKRRAGLRSAWSVHVVSREDRALCENVQRGMRHDAFERGWYVNDPAAHGISEHAMRHFHHIYVATLESRA